MNLHQTRRPLAFAEATACSTCSSVIPFLIFRSISALPDSTPSSSVSKLAVLSRRMNSSSTRSTRVWAEKLTRRWNPRSMIPSRIAFVLPMCSPNVSSSIRIRCGPVALEDLLDLVEDVRGRPVARLEARVVAAEHALERAAAVRDQRQRPDGPEEIPRREGEQVVVVGRRARRRSHDLVPAPRDEPGDRRRIGAALERVGELRARYSPRRRTRSRTLAFLESLAADGVDVRAADDDRHVRAIVLDPPRDLDGLRVLDRHACDPDEIGPPVAHARDDVVDRQSGELAVEQVDLVAGGAERAGDVGDAEPREARPVPVELTARRGLDERDPHAGTESRRRKKPRRPRDTKSTREKPAAVSIASATDSV